jgi:YesN/AraC family two-component response regulator
MVRPDIFEGLPDLLMVNEEKELEPRRYESSSLNDGQKERIHSQLLAHMEAQKPWLNQELTLNELAGQLNLNARYLSQVINERQQQNFMDFINGYRIRRAQELLCHPAYSYFTVLAIAQEVGFKSRSAFYTAFKTLTGKTPTAYREEQMQAGESVS